MNRLNKQRLSSCSGENIDKQNNFKAVVVELANGYGFRREAELWITKNKVSYRYTRLSDECFALDSFSRREDGCTDLFWKYENNEISFTNSFNAIAQAIDKYDTPINNVEMLDAGSFEITLLYQSGKTKKIYRDGDINFYLNDFSLVEIANMIMSLIPKCHRILNYLCVSDEDDELYAKLPNENINIV